MLTADLIVVDEGTELRVVTQPDHSHFAAELMSLWRTHGLPDHRLLKLADTLSLKVCRRGESHVGRLGVRGGSENGSLVLEPFPLAGATTFRIPWRWIPNRPYDRDSDLGSELPAARWQTFPVRVVPAQAGRRCP